jgi:hypothetical protein
MRRKKASKMIITEPTVLRRRSFINKIGLAGLACALLLMPWTAGNALQDNGKTLGTRGENKQMTVAQQCSQSMPADRTIPPIDAAAPAATETATFALG